MPVQKQQTNIPAKVRRIDFPAMPAMFHVEQQAVAERWYFDLRTVLQRHFDDVEVIIASIQTPTVTAADYTFEDTATVDFTVTGRNVKADAKITEGPPGPRGRDGSDGRNGTNGADGDDAPIPTGGTGTAICDPANPGQIIITFDTFTYD